MSSGAIDKKKKDLSALEIIPAIKKNFRPDMIFKVGTLAILIGEDEQSADAKLRRIRNKEVDGIIIFRVKTRSKSNWFYKKIGP